jgi:hypothetical protein
MKRSLLFLAVLCSSFAANSQNKFIPGYFITRDGQRTECQVLIRNEFWKDNPKSFDYRMDEGSSGRAADLSNIAELGVTDGAVYRLLTVDMDRSTNDVGKLNHERNPEFKRETLFLRLVLAAKATLYEYEEGNLKRYFYSIDQGELKQLVFKRYLNNNGEMLSNETYKQQLFTEMKCKSITKEDAERLSYDLSSFSKFFTKYNDCQGSAVAAYQETKQNKLAIHLVIRPGITQNAVLIKNISIGGGGTAEISGVTSYRIGLEAEGILPFGAGLWALPVEASYQSFSGSSGISSVTYSSLDLQAGARRFFPVGESAKLYLTAGILFALPQSSSSMNVGANGLRVESSISATLAAGYRINNLSFEFNYGTKRRISAGNVYDADMSNYAFIFGYSFALK